MEKTNTSMAQASHQEILAWRSHQYWGRRRPFYPDSS